MAQGEPRHLRILHVIASLWRQIGGPAVHTVEQCRALQSSGVEVSLMTTDLTSVQAPPPRTGVGLDGMPDGTEEIDVTIFPLRWPTRLAYSPALGQALESDTRKFDLVHIHGLNLYPTFAAARAARHATVPYIVQPHGALDPWIRGRGRLRKHVNDTIWQRRMLDGAAALHLATTGERDLIRPMALRPPHRVVPPGIQGVWFEPPSEVSIRDRLFGGFSGPLILNHGRLSEKKGLDLLVAALPLVLQQIPDARVALVGPDDEGVGDRIRLLAQELGITDSLVILPSMTGGDLRDVVAAADVWVLPSHTENFGIAVVEAMATGRAIIASPAVNTAPDAARAGALEMVTNDPPVLAEAIVSLLKEDVRRQILGGAARIYAHQFDGHLLADQLIGMYREVAHQQGVSS